LFRIRPDIKRATDLEWLEDGATKNFEMLCELMKINAIPLKKINCFCDEIEANLRGQ